jgi:hypothetical protein
MANQYTYTPTGGFYIEGEPTVGSNPYQGKGGPILYGDFPSRVVHANGAAAVTDYILDTMLAVLWTRR